jgi:hypothetical protein
VQTRLWMNLAGVCGKSPTFGTIRTVGAQGKGPKMTYQLQFLRDDGSPACFFMTQCVSDEQAKAIARSVLDLQFAGVEILRGEQVIYHQLKSAKPN